MLRRLLKERTGSSQYAITKYAEEKHGKNLPPNFKKMVLVHLKKLVGDGKLVRVKSSFKLPATRSATGAAVKPKPKAAANPKAKSKALAKSPAKAKAKAKAKPKATTKAKPKAAAKSKAKTAPAKAKVAAAVTAPAKKAAPAKRNRRKTMNNHLAALRSLMPASFVQRVCSCSLTVFFNSSDELSCS